MMISVLLSKIIDDHIFAINRPPEKLKLYPAMVEMLCQEWPMMRADQNGKIILEFEGIPIEIIPIDLPNISMKLSRDLID